MKEFFTATIPTFLQNCWMWVEGALVILAIVLIVWLIIKGAKNKSLKKKLVIVENQSKDLETELQTTKDELSHLTTAIETENEKRSTAVAEYETQITEKDNMIKTLEEKITDLESSNATQSKTLKQTEEYIEGIREDYYELQDKFNAEQTQKQNLTKAYDEMRNLYSHVENTIKTLQDNLADTIENANIAIKNSAEINEKNKEYLAQIHDLENQVKKLKSYEEENAALVKTIRKLAGMDLEKEEEPNDSVEKMTRKELFAAAKKAGLPNVTCLSTEKIRELVKEALKNK